MEIIKKLDSNKVNSRFNNKTNIINSVVEKFHFYLNFLISNRISVILFLYVRFYVMFITLMVIV